MVDIGKFYVNEIPPKDESIVDLVRVACYSSQIEEAIGAINDLHVKGYETALNIMAISRVNETELRQQLYKVRSSKVDIVYIVDSFGSLYMDDINRLTKIYKRSLPGKQIGIHAHNNLQLAFANTITANQAGCRFMDSTVYGMGRAAGNCPTELLIGYLYPKYNIKPILKAIEELFIPLRELEEWGYLIPYALSGQLNEHPRTAIELRNQTEAKDNYLEFYEQTTKDKDRPLQVAR